MVNHRDLAGDAEKKRRRKEKEECGNTDIGLRKDVGKSRNYMNVGLYETH